MLELSPTVALAAEYRSLLFARQNSNYVKDTISYYYFCSLGYFTFPFLGHTLISFPQTNPRKKPCVAWYS